MHHSLHQKNYDGFRVLISYKLKVTNTNCRFFVLDRTILDIHQSNKMQSGEHKWFYTDDK